MILGGGYVQNYKASSALGTNPASASATVVVDTANNGSFEIALGKYVIFAFSPFATFHGVVTSAVQTTSDPESGSVWSVELADNRIRLQWIQVFGKFNIDDEAMAKGLGRPDSPAVPTDSSSNGSDDVLIGGSLEGSGPIEGYSVSAPSDTGVIRRRYCSILPKDWKSGIVTWHDAPFTAREILNFAFKDAWGDFGFTRNYHSALSDVVLTGLDYSSGVRLANLISTMNEQAGLEIAMSGARTIVWYRRGVGIPPVPDASSRNISTGAAITANDTAVRVVGEPIRIQICNIALEPDWKSGWEEFIDEVAWLREVAVAWEMPNANKVHWAEIAAKAREVTVAQYAAKKENAAFLDHRLWGNVSRNHMPAWLYIQEIVFRSYRIPPDKTFYGVPLSSLEIADSLICGVDLKVEEGGASKQDYVKNPVDFYPSTQAHVIAKGQPIDLIDSRDARSFVYKRATDLRETWSVMSDFQVDARNMSIRFASPVVIDGPRGAGKSLYVYPNKGEAGGTSIIAKVADQSDYLDVVVPNPDCELNPAEVKVALCFIFGARFHRDYGVGPRRGSMPVSGLGLHLIDASGADAPSVAGIAAFSSADLPLPSPGGGDFKEVLYADGKSAIEKADAAADSVIGLSPVEASGGFKRHGVVGTSISGVVDRVTVTVDMSGVSEEVTSTKARPSGIAFSDRTLTRIQRTSEVISGQQELRNEVRQFRTLANMLKAGRNGAKDQTHPLFGSVFKKPVGSEKPSTQIILNRKNVYPDRNGFHAWKAGDIVWLDESGNPSLEGTSLAGVLVIQPKSTGGDGGQYKELVVCQSGVVPVRVTEGILPGALVMANPGDYQGGPRGRVAVGRLLHDQAVPKVDEGGEVLAMVRLGSAGKEAGRFIVTWDRYAKRLYVSEGTVGASNAYYTQSFVRPIDPTLGGIKLAEAVPPSFDVTKEGKYEIVCVFDSIKARIEIFDVDEPLVLNNCERAWLIASCEFIKVDGKIVLKGSINQRWESDIPWQFFDYSMDCSSGDSSDDSGDSGDDSGDSGDSTENSGDDSGGSDDGSSDDGGGSNEDSSDDSGGSDESDDPCCPEVVINSVVFSVGQDNCFAERDPANPNARQAATVAVNVTVTGNPCQCGGAWVRVKVAQQIVGMAYMGLSGSGTYDFVKEIAVFPCSQVEVEACWFTSTVGVAVGDPCRGLNCCASTTVSTPGYCDESCDGSGSGSGGSEESGGSSDESGSGSGSGSGDSSGDKNCIVPMPDGSYAAMSCFEFQNNYLGFFMADVPVAGRLTRIPIDPRFLFVCQSGSIRVLSAESGSTRRAGVRVDGADLVIAAPLLRRPSLLQITLIGIKKDADRPWNPRTHRQYLKNLSHYQELNR